MIYWKFLLVSYWSTSQYVEKIYRVFVKTTLGVAFHHLGSAFINAYIVKLQQTWISWNPFSIYLNLLALQFLESSKCIILC